ncbi:MAG: sortase family protein [Thermoleophilia bacterium]|nr:sortase family protein [Thermoleophilia bacterium]
MNRLTYPDIARILGTGLISTGLGLLMFVVVTIAWGDPFTRLSAQGEQQKLARQFAGVAPVSGDLTDAKLDYELTIRAATLAKKTTKLGAPAGRITIPRIKMKRIFVNGARVPDLKKGPGLYKEVRFPGSGAPVAIAGHRTTHGAPFLHIDQLRKGDAIVLTMPYGRFTYRMTRTQIITPRDWTIINYGAAEPTSSARTAVARSRQCIETCEHLVLTACHPKYSAAKRIAVFARLSKVELSAGGAT